MLAHLMDAVPATARAEAHEQAALDENVLALAAEMGRRKKFASLRLLLGLRRNSVRM